MFAIGIGLTIFCWVVGFPIWAAFGLGGLFLMVFWQGQQLLVYPHIFFQGMDSYSLLALPFFMLSGQMMISGGAAKALFRWLESFVGHFTGGLAVAAVIACMFFGTISGSTVATMAAISSICIPMMLEKKYDKNSSLGLLAASSSLGQLIPPSIIVIVYASLTGAPIDILFFSGFFPGFILTAMLCIAAVFMFRWKGGVVAIPRASWAVRWKSTLYALPAMTIPVIILGGIYSGLMTPVEAAAVSVFVCIPVAIVYKSFNRKMMWDAMKKAAITTSMIYFILGGTILFINVMTYAEVPQMLINLVQKVNMGPTMLLMVLTCVLILLDTMMEPMPMVLLVVPLTAKMVFASGIHWITFNFLLLQYSAIAFCTPPLALALFVQAQMFHTRVEDVAKGVWPYLIILFIHMLLFLCFPEWLLWLPRLVFGARVDMPLAY
jgi:C4-dicarboxylate transporter, DctM subunit